MDFRLSPPRAVGEIQQWCRAEAPLAHAGLEGDVSLYKSIADVYFIILISCIFLYYL